MDGWMNDFHLCSDISHRNEKYCKIENAVCFTADIVLKSLIAQSVCEACVHQITEKKISIHTDIPAGHYFGDTRSYREEGYELGVLPPELIQIDMLDDRFLIRVYIPEKSSAD